MNKCQRCRHLSTRACPNVLIFIRFEVARASSGISFHFFWPFLEFGGPCAFADFCPSRTTTQDARNAVIKDRLITRKARVIQLSESHPLSWAVISIHVVSPRCEIFESFRFIHITIEAAFAYVDFVYLNLHSLGSLVALMKLLGISYTVQLETVQSRKSLECVLKLSDCSIRLLSSYFFNEGQYSFSSAFS